MQLRSDAHRRVALTLGGAALAALSGCGGPSSPSPVEQPSQGAMTVRGTERLAWTQAGGASELRFRAYIDDRPMDLDAAACDGAVPAECNSLLPSLTDGIHTITLTNISTISGVESARSDAITVQKVSARAATRAAAFPDARTPAGTLRLEHVVTTDDGLSFAVDVVARRVRAPSQLAWLPDGRLLVAEANGRVRVIRPGEPERGEPALVAHDLLDSSLIGPLGLASHPDFQLNHFVYASLLGGERSGRTLLRIVRLREVGDLLGEPATLFETPVSVTSGTSDGSQPHASKGTDDGPRLAFGPDRLLYIALPIGVEFEREPAASRPLAAMLRLSDQGRVPAIGPLSGLDEHPLAFTWHPSTGAMLVVVPNRSGAVMLRSIVPGGVSGIEPGRLGRMADRPDQPSGAWTFQRAEPDLLQLVRAFVASAKLDSPGIVRLTLPVRADNLLAGALDRVGDVVAGGSGTFFVATANIGQAGTGTTDSGDVILRFTLLTR